MELLILLATIALIIALLPIGIAIIMAILGSIALLFQRDPFYDKDLDAIGSFTKEEKKEIVKHRIIMERVNNPDERTIPQAER